MSSLRTKVDELLTEWSGHYGQSGNVINYLVEFMVDDSYWLRENIRKEDKRLLIELVKELEK